MVEPSGMDRRGFLQRSAIGIVVVGVGIACGASHPDDRELATPALAALIGAARARGLGARYRQMVPAERDAPTLRALLAHEDRTGFQLPWTKPTPLGVRASNDFAAGRTVLVDGWLLSRTEARQCALMDALSA